MPSPNPETFKSQTVSRTLASATSATLSDAPYRRREIRLPSIWGNLFWALAFIAILSVAIWVYIEAFGDPDAGRPEGSVQVDPRPMPPESDTLAGSSAVLPDLLDGDVPQNVNPTLNLETGTLGTGAEQGGPTRDALGNPLPGTLQSVPQNASSIPKVITINGQSVTPRDALAPAPISGLSRAGTFGPVPARDSRGVTPVSAYKRPFTLPAGRSPVSVIIGGLGINRAVTQQAISTLPPEVTLSFAAHAPDLQNWVNQARAAGHEVLLELPMESSDFDPTEPGADRALMSDNPQGRNVRNLEWMMSRAQGYFGVTNFNGDKFLTRTDAVGPVISELSNSGLSFIYDGSASAPSLPLISSNAGLPFSQAYTLLDVTPNLANIEIELARLKAQASAGNGAIGFGFAYPQTLTAVAAWTQSLSEQNIVLAPASSNLPQ